MRVVRFSGGKNRLYVSEISMFGGFVYFKPMKWLRMLVIRDIQEHYNQIRPTRKGGLYLLETWKLGRMLT